MSDAALNFVMRRWPARYWSWGFASARAFPFAAFAFFRAMTGYYGFGLRLVPDFDLYTQGGYGVYPSPLGRLLGSALGAGGLVLLHAAGAAALVVFVSRYSAGFLPVVAATFLPLGWITAFAGIDAIAASLFIFSWVNRRSKSGGIGLAIACALHLALLPVLLAVSVWRVRGRCSLAAVATLVWLAVAGFAALLLTPYGGVLGHLAHPRELVTFTFVTAVTAGGIWLLVSRLPWVRVHGSGMLADGLVMFAAGCVEAGVQLHAQARYCLPGFILMCTALREGRRA